MGLLHAAIVNKIDGCRLAAICDKNKLMLKFLKSGIRNLETYTDYMSMIEEQPLDVIIITTPTSLHARMAESAMKAGIGVLIEKPLARSAKECERLLAYRQTARSLVGYCRRFMPTYGLAKKVIYNEELGKPLSFNSYIAVNQVDKVSNGWQHTPAQSGGGVLIDLGCHAIDLIHWLLGPTESVACETKQIYSTFVEDTAILKMQMEDGMQGELYACWSEPGFRAPELLLDVHFEKGRIVVTEKYIEVTKGNGVKRKIYKQMIHEQVPLNIGGPEYTSEDVHLVDCVKAGVDTQCDVRVGAQTNSVIDSAYASATDRTRHKVIYAGG